MFRVRRLLTSFSCSLHLSHFSVLLCFLLFTALPAKQSVATMPELFHPASYSGKENIEGWLMSEKLDGIRGYWDGKVMRTRQGHEIAAPHWFVAQLPPFPLDGELWRARNDFNFVQNTVLDGTPSQGWREITYNIFEVPEAAGDFPTRLDTAQRWFAEHPAPHVHLIEQIPCLGADHLDAFLAKIEALGGEGVVVRNPALAYHTGRSQEILKVKNFRDMEGVVIAHNPGRGKFSGLLGSLTLRIEGGIEFRLGTGFSNELRRNPPPLGSVVTFKYQGLTVNGVPRFASFLHERRD